jgi:hypothetical protein
VDHAEALVIGNEGVQHEEDNHARKHILEVLGSYAFVEVGSV